MWWYWFLYATFAVPKCLAFLKFLIGTAVYIISIWVHLLHILQQIALWCFATVLQETKHENLDAIGRFYVK